MFEDTLLEKLQYILSNKELIKQAIKDIGSETISDETLFKDYSSEIMKIHSNIVEVCKMLYFLVYGGDINEIIVEEPTIKDTFPYIQKLSKAKTQLVDNLVLKGINSSITEEFLDLIDKVLLITPSTPSGGVDANYVATMLDDINGEVIPKDEPDPEPEPTERVLFEKELYNFVNKNVSKIYNLTKRKSINKILQIYDLNTQEINDMNIYSANDFLEITSQIFMVGNIEGVTCNGSYIDTNSYNDDENGYATFNLNLRYTNEELLNLKIYLANNSTTTPQLKFGVVTE